VTHWDDDHVGGIADVATECENATVACSLALQREDILQFVFTQADASRASGLDELGRTLRLCRPQGRLVWAVARRPLHPKRAGDDATVTALSPSDDAVSRSIESLIEAAAGTPVTIPRRYRAPEGPNGASVVTSVRTNDTSVLLGADLANSNNAATGWDAVLTDAKPGTRASLVKVPHHGSEGAHHAGVWSELADADPVAVVTPWVLAGGHLPTQADLDRLRGVTGRLYLTAMPTLGKAQKDPAVERLVTKVAGISIQELRGWGHVRARRRPDEGAWRVDCDGDARPVTS
jgi:hypothetical protein